jgi:hypothetical protein
MFEQIQDPISPSPANLVDLGVKHAPKAYKDGQSPFQNLLVQDIPQLQNEHPQQMQFSPGQGPVLQAREGLVCELVGFGGVGAED